MLDWDKVSFFGEFGIVVDSVYLKWSETMFDFDSASDTYHDLLVSRQNEE